MGRYLEQRFAFWQPEIHSDKSGLWTPVIRLPFLLHPGLQTPELKRH
jgi:hypothetical protein